jgi:hypothetical protein
METSHAELDYLSKLESGAKVWGGRCGRLQLQRRVGLGAGRGDRAKTHGPESDLFRTSGLPAFFNRPVNRPLLPPVLDGNGRAGRG